jgi:hypothetical protein
VAVGWGRITGALREPSSSRFRGDVFSQKSRKASAMAAAAKKQTARSGDRRSDSAAIPCLVFKDNSSDCCWTILVSDGFGSGGS